MNAHPKNFGVKATAVALVAATSLTLAAPAFADGRHHRNDGRGWSWSDRRHDDRGGQGGGHYRGHDDGNDDALAAVAIIGGVLLGAALLSSASQPAYAESQPVYAPSPYGQSYGYGQAPIQAVPSSVIYQTQSGQYCREYQSQVNVGGRMQYSYGAACQQPDGSWRVVN